MGTIILIILVRFLKIHLFLVISIDYFSTPPHYQILILLNTLINIFYCSWLFILHNLIVSQSKFIPLEVFSKLIFFIFNFDLDTQHNNLSLVVVFLGYKKSVPSVLNHSNMWSTWFPQYFLHPHTRLPSKHFDFKTPFHDILWQFL